VLQVCDRLASCSAVGRLSTGAGLAHEALRSRPSSRRSVCTSPPDAPDLPSRHSGCCSGACLLVGPSCRAAQLRPLFTVCLLARQLLALHYAQGATQVGGGVLARACSKPHGSRSRAGAHAATAAAFSSYSPHKQAVHHQPPCSAQFHICAVPHSISKQKRSRAARCPHSPSPLQQSHPRRTVSHECRPPIEHTVSCALPRVEAPPARDARDSNVKAGCEPRARDSNVKAGCEPRAKAAMLERPHTATASCWPVHQHDWRLQAPERSRMAGGRQRGASQPAWPCTPFLPWSCFAGYR
jgi:hypothetical protein